MQLHFYWASENLLSLKQHSIIYLPEEVQKTVLIKICNVKLDERGRHNGIVIVYKLFHCD